ncbi:MAG: hypothetical protein IPH80_41555 [Myxococcales bacterium]|nr:hypothetical protein [Myxococcales bacterium]
MREPARPEAPPPRPLPPARAAGASTLIAPLVAAALLPPGWMFIAHAHRWHLTPSVIVLCLAWTAVVGAGYALVRAGNAFLDEVPEDWFTAGGTHAELEREKKSLVRAIKEIEFDRDTGKLSAADAAALLTAYRARAIEVIKALDLDAAGLSPRDRVLAELKARAQIDRQAGKAQARRLGPPRRARRPRTTASRRPRRRRRPSPPRRRRPRPSNPRWRPRPPRPPPPRRRWRPRRR